MRKSINAPAIKPKPQRTCVTCRQVKAKHELFRLVKIPDGVVEIDVTGKKNGRGAYLCRLRKCWETALKSGRLEHSLSVIIEPENREELVRSAEELFPDA